MVVEVVADGKSNDRISPRYLLPGGRALFERGLAAHIISCVSRCRRCEDHSPTISECRLYFQAVTSYGLANLKRIVLGRDQVRVELVR